MKTLEFIPPPGITAEDVAARLGALGRVRVESARPLRRTLLDRSDGILREQGVTLEWQATPDGHQLAWRDGPRNPISLPLQAPAPRHASALPEGLLRRRLLRSTGHGDLVEVASVQGSSHRIRLLDREEKTVCWVSVEHGSAADPGRNRSLRLRKRVCVTPVKGFESLATRIAVHLGELPGWRPSEETLFDEAIRRTGRGEDSKLRSRIADLLRAMEKHRAAIDPAGDPEALHDFRVCLRRVRTLFAELGTLSVSRSIAGELKWLGRVSGEARDLDVQAEDLRRTLRDRGPNVGTLGPRIEAQIEDLRREAHRRLGDALASPRYARLLRCAQAELRSERPRGKEPDREGAPTRAPLRAEALYRKALRQGRRLGPHAPDERFHRLRKTLKKLRYLLEANLERSGAGRGDEGVKSLKGMQTILGELNDLSVQRGLLDELKTRIGTGAEAPDEVHRGLDALLERAEERRRSLKTDFTRHFENLSTKDTRRNLLGPEDTGRDRAS